MPVDPSRLQIVSYPAPVLRQKAIPVPEVTDEVRAVARRMIELMRQAEGIGLAAPQVGLPWRMFVVHVPEGDDRSASGDPISATAAPTVYINPVLTGLIGKLIPHEEGCLSLPDVRGEVLRPEVATIRAMGTDGREFTQHGAGLLARCWQHENDHLDGVLIIDRMTPLSRMSNKAAIRELEAAGG